MIKRLLTKATHKIHAMPVLVLMPHSRCNCRCMMCDIWKANHEKKELSPETIGEHIATFRKLGVKRVALSGGEALMHSNLWEVCRQFHAIGTKISLLSTGILLSKHAREIVEHCDDVIVSLDGSPMVHNAIRNIPLAFEKLELGVKALKEAKPSFRVTGRCVLQKANFRDIPNTIRTSIQLSLDQISFLAADVSSFAFNHPAGWDQDKRNFVVPTLFETEELEETVRQTFVEFKREYQAHYIAESPNKMLQLVQYFRAIHGEGTFPAQHCNAPWVSAVIESNGDVMPCFFHKPYGNIFNGSFAEIINSEKAIAFRKNLNIDKDETCQKCVCSLYLKG